LLDLMKTAGISVEPRDMRPSDVTMPASV
jgi:hypothetical protein